MQKKVEYIKTKLPLTITSLNWEEPLLHLSGEEWKFNARTEWRLISRDKTVIGCYDENSKSTLETLKCLQIITVYSQSEYFFDPVFIFENGSVLEIFSTSTAEETWTLHFKDENVFLESNES